MEVTATYRITEKAKAHFAMRQLEQLVNVAFLPFTMREIIIDDIDYIFGCAERFQKQMSDNGFSYTKDESVIASIILKNEQRTLVTSVMSKLYNIKQSPSPDYFTYILYIGKEAGP